MVLEEGTAGENRPHLTGHIYSVTSNGYGVISKGYGVASNDYGAIRHDYGIIRNGHGVMVLEEGAAGENRPHLTGHIYNGVTIVSQLC
jgi:hypothetical protein